MLDRIKVLMDTMGLSASQFADGMDVPRAVLSHILSGRNKPSLDVVLKIASTYRDVSLEWLLLGSGEMLIDLAAPTTSNVGKIQETPIQVHEPEAHQESFKEPEKVQMQDSVSLLDLPKKSNGRSVKQVMIFYTDGTFEAYNPG